MALDPVPWFIGGAAEHSAEAARNIAWNATQGRTGVANPSSLKVSQLSTAGGGVRVSPGGAAIESTYAGASQQSYTIRNDASTTVSVAANTGTGTITRYVVVRVTDPQYAGSAPSNPVVGPYVSFQVVSSQSSTHPQLVLARLRIPPNTSTITSSMITDMRELLAPRRTEVVHARPRVLADSSAGVNLTVLRSAGGEYFPGGNGSPNQFQVDIPAWATRMVIDASWMGVRYASSTNAYGRYWVEFGDEYRDRTWPGNQQWEFATQDFQFDSPGASNNTMRTNWILMDAVPVPSKLRGKEATFVFKAGRGANSAGGSAVSMDALSGLGMRITFAEEAIDYDTV